MKKLLVGTSLALAAVVAAPQLEAQAKPEFGASIGVALPMGDLADVQGTGFRVGGLVQLKPASLPVAIRGELNFTSLGGKDINILGQNLDTGSSSIFDATVNAVYGFPAAKDATTSFYAIGGAGLYNSSDLFDTKFGINAGAGVNFNLAGFKAFGEARFHNVFADGGSARLIPITFGIRF